LRAETLGWPMAWSRNGFERLQGVARVRGALEHLVRTPLGAYWVDPQYGTIFHKLRTQGMTLDEGTEDGGGLSAVAVSHFQQQAAVYVPSAVIHGVTPRVNPGSRLVIHVIWTVASAGGQGGPGSLQASGLGAMAPLSVVV